MLVLIVSNELCAHIWRLSLYDKLTKEGGLSELSRLRTPVGSVRRGFAMCNDLWYGWRVSVFSKKYVTI